MLAGRKLGVNLTSKKLISFLEADVILFFFSFSPDFSLGLTIKHVRFVTFGCSKMATITKR